MEPVSFFGAGSRGEIERAIAIGSKALDVEIAPEERVHERN